MCLELSLANKNNQGNTLSFPESPVAPSNWKRQAKELEKKHAFIQITQKLQI